ncbi:MAG: DNA repair protein RadC [bacterium]
MEELMPREKIINLGVESLQDYELLAVLLGTGSKDENVLDLSKRILLEFSGLNDIVNMKIEDWMLIKGIKEKKAATLVAFLEFSKRIYRYEKKDISLKTCNEVYDYVKYELNGKSHEELLILFVNVRCKLISIKRSIGSTSILYVDIKEVVNQGIRCKASGVFLIHNHPSGDTTPSISDIDLTNSLKKAFNFFDIKVLDHLIIGENNYFSFTSNNLL